VMVVVCAILRDGLGAFEVGTRIRREARRKSAVSRMDRPRSARGEVRGVTVDSAWCGNFDGRDAGMRRVTVFPEQSRFLRNGFMTLGSARELLG
jgi:hypothetical protein